MRYSDFSIYRKIKGEDDNYSLNIPILGKPRVLSQSAKMDLYAWFSNRVLAGIPLVCKYKCKIKLKHSTILWARGVL